MAAQRGPKQSGLAGNPAGLVQRAPLRWSPGQMQLEPRESWFPVNPARLVPWVPVVPRVMLPMAPLSGRRGPSRLAGLVQHSLLWVFWRLTLALAWVAIRRSRRAGAEEVNLGGLRGNR